jgi:hypothetical protein
MLALCRKECHQRMKDGWGDEKMKKIIIACAILAVCFGLTGMVQAMQPAVSGEPFIAISVTPDKIDLGMISPTGFKNVPAKLEAHVIANCPHQVKATFEPFRRKDSGVTIRPEHTAVEINGINVPVAGSGVPIVSSVNPTPPGGVDVPVDIKFSARGLLLYPAGPYRGCIVLTIMTKP